MKNNTGQVLGHLVVYGLIASCFYAGFWIIGSLLIFGYLVNNNLWP